MSTQDTSRPTPPPARNDVLHKAAIAGAILCPLAMLLPPRKADIRSFVLFGSFSLCINQLAYDYSGQSVYERFGSRVGSVFDTSLPQGAQRTQQLLREQREKEAAWKRQQQDQDQRQQDKQDGSKSGLLRDIWMGGEDEDWRRRRAEEHRKSFQEGKGMSDVMFEQVADVLSGRWRGGKKEGEGEGENKGGAASNDAGDSASDEASDEAKREDKKK